MSNNRRDLIGTELSRFSYIVEKGKIKELAQAIGDDNPLYTDSDYAQTQGYLNIITPPTFGTCIDFWEGQDFMALCSKLQLNPVKVLHGGQEYQYLGEINPGDEIEACCTLKRIIEKNKMHILILETNYQNQRGDTVLISRSTIIERK